MEVKKEFKRAVASQTAAVEEQAIENVERSAAKVSASNSEKTTLGDLDALASLKEKMKEKK